MNRNIKSLIALSALTVWTSNAWSDEFHYKSLVIGERAGGMGGAYVAISDDPTGVFYNPAGLVFGLENYISASANTFNISSTEFKDIVGDQDYTLTSSGLVPTFFGFSQNWGRSKIGFAIVVPNSELIDQDEEITELNSGPDQAHTLRRRFFRQDITYQGGPAFSRALSDTASFGISVLGFARLDNGFDNQLIKFNDASGGVESGEGKYFFQNTYLKQTIFGATPKIGMQYMPTSTLSLGMTVSTPFNISGSASTKQIVSNNLRADGYTPQNGEFENDIKITEAEFSTRVSSPIQVTVGAAYFLSKALLFAADIDYFSEDFFANPAVGEFVAQQTINWSVGSEWYMSDSFALRTGVYSNNANTPSINDKLTDQPAHVNLIGGTLAVSLLKPGSSFTLGTQYARGTGEGQAIGGLPTVQETTMTNLSLFLSGSYQL